MARQGGAKITELSEDNSYRKKKGYRWMLTTTAGKTRKRTFYYHGEKKKAEQAKLEFEKQANRLAKKDRGILHDDEILAEAAEAYKQLTPYGRSLKDAVDFYIQHLKEREKEDNTPLHEAVGLWLADKEKEGINTTRYRQTLNRFEKAFPDRTISNIEGSEIKAWYQSFGKISNQKPNRTDVNTFFNWLVKDDGKFKKFSHNPVPKPPKENKKLKQARKRVMLSPTQVKTYLDTCAEHDPELLPLLVVQAFIGIRIDESLRLTWELFDFEEQQLNIPADIAKGGEKHARTNKIPANAQKWLKPFEHNLTGKVATSVNTKNSFNSRIGSIRRKAGWKSGTWPQNALRKTFISCHFAKYKNATETATVAGTSIQLIENNYKVTVAETIAKKLWLITPKK